MKITDILHEMPVRSWSAVGDFDTPKSMDRPEDLALVKHPKYEPKVRRLFSKVALPIDMIFVNDEAIEGGTQAAMDARTFTSITGLAAPAPDAITMVYGTSQGRAGGGLPNTPWILAHKIGECLSNNHAFVDAFDDRWSDFLRIKRNLLIPKFGRSPTGKNVGTYISSETLFNLILTMKSARDKTLRNPSEAIAECVAQYLITGAITLKRTGVFPFDREAVMMRNDMVKAIQHALPTMIGHAFQV